MDPDDFAPARSTNLLWHDAAHRSEGPWPPARRMGLQPYWDNMSSWDVVMTLVPCTLFLVSLNACCTPCRDGARCWQHAALLQTFAAEYPWVMIRVEAALHQEGTAKQAGQHLNGAGR